MKRTELKRKTPLQSHTSLRRTPMKKRRGNAAKSREFSQSVRQQIYDRTNGICEMCKQRPAVHIHHAIYRSQGGSGDISNALHLCLRCHERCHSNRETRMLAVRLAHRLAGIDVDGDRDTSVSAAEFIG